MKFVVSGKLVYNASMQSDMAILLLGLKHSGKSSVGEILAARMGRHYIDLDRVCVQENAERGGVERTAADIYRAHGVEHWQQLERVAAGQVAEQTRRMPAVVALGGGVMDNRAAMQTLGAVGMFIYLQANCQVLYDRFMSKKVPAFLEVTTPGATLHATPRTTAHAKWMQLCARRARLCTRYADITIATDGRSIAEICNRLCTQLVGAQTNAG